MRTKLPAALIQLHALELMTALFWLSYNPCEGTRKRARLLLDKLGITLDDVQSDGMNDDDSLILGVDPGFTGGLAWYSPKSQRLVAVMPMPLCAKKVMIPDTRREIDAHMLARALNRHCESLALCVVERVNASPKMGVTSAFRFGEGYGLIQGILAAQGHIARNVYPSVWKAALGLSSDKQKSVDLACSLFPEWGDTLRAGRKSADLAEAALLAYYGARFHKNDRNEP